ncbi:MAG TPA: serine hydrolase domain-containing protein [Bryobacteraceae bacterium]|nr:serine hydrolase domain-containing protein [Bryobacteraceae bacterium]
MRTFLSFFVVISLLFSANLPTSQPSQQGLSQERLERINTVMREHVESGRLPGASALLVRNGKVVFRGAWGEFKPDTMVRMYSMTKAITGVAAMMLYEEGRFSLTDPVSKYLPEFTKMTVAVTTTDASGKKVHSTVPAERPITVRDLFRHTTGLDYAGPLDDAGKTAYSKLGIDSGAPQVDFDLKELVKRLASAPLNDQPGTTFRYGFSTDVLGRLVEVVSGKPLDQFFEERIFKPLGMKDSGFFVPEEKWNRLATLYAPKRGGGLERATFAAQDSFKKKPGLLLGGAGSVGTLDDYARFCAMLANDGQLDGVRLLGRKTVELMRSDHLGSLAKAGLVQEGYGFGLTFAVNLGPGKNATVGSAGEFYWGGAAGTSFWIDPKEKMFGVFLIQVLPPTGIPAADQFKRMAYQALVD